MTPLDQQRPETSRFDPLECPRPSIGMTEKNSILIAIEIDQSEDDSDVAGLLEKPKRFVHS
jgi:hypothetical protein